MVDSTDSATREVFPPSGQREPTPTQSYDPQLVEQTKHQIRQLVHEITQLSQQDLPATEFYDGFLRRVVSALAAVGGAVWTLAGDGQLELQYQIGLSRTGLTEDQQAAARHHRLLRQVVTTGGGSLAPPESGASDADEAGNPTDLLIVLAPISLEKNVAGVVEIFQRPGGGPMTQRGYLRFLSQMCELAGDYLKNQRLQHYSDRQDLWEKLERFLRSSHQSLDPKGTAFTIANEGRRLIECDRLSVALFRHRRLTLEAISGVESINRRANSVRLLEQLSAAVLATGEPLWYHGNSDDVPPQIEKRLHAYIDQSHARTLAVLPLRRPVAAQSLPGSDSSARQPAQGEVIGALIVEQIKDNRLPETLSRRVEVVAEHSAAALTNALEYASLPLIGLWQALGGARWLFSVRQLPRTLLIAAALFAAVTALVVVPGDFELAATGTLEPIARREVFARSDGVVEEVLVEHGQPVEPDQPLVRLRNTELELAITDLIGKQTSTREQMLAVQRALLSEQRLSIDEQNRLSGQLLQLREAAESLDKQLALYRQQEAQLVIRSPIRGEVATWDVQDLLARRPVQRGQALLTIFDPQDQWQLHLRIPERRMEHVTRAWQRSGESGVPVTFLLATHPGERYQGEMFQIHTTAEAEGEEGTTVAAKARVNAAELPDLRPGATVNARVYCGRQPIGYVWFHDLLEFAQTNILFWL